MANRYRASERRPPPQRYGEDGFTLIEALVALVVLAVGSAALLQASMAHTGRVGDLETQAAARLIAEARMADYRLAPSATAQAPRDVRAFDRDWRIVAEFVPTEEPSISKVTLRVEPRDGAGPAAVMVGFIESETTE